MKQLFSIIALLSILNLTVAQDLTKGLRLNDLSPRKMKPLAKPGYLKTVTDPSFGTTIRRISNANAGEVIKPMYSTVQAWNADESLMILYKRNSGHILLNGKTYKFIRNLGDIRPDDIENVFWDFNNPDIFYYLDGSTNEFISYTVSSSNKKVIVDLDTKVTNCSGSFSMGSDVQMMSWNSDVFGFICNNERAYYYRISTGKLVEFDIANVGNNAPMPAPSGKYFYHNKAIYNAEGKFHKNLNESDVKPWTEHACLGKLSNGKDGYFAVAFNQSRRGGCLGDVVAHNVETSNCYTITSQDQGYEYTQSNTHISALSHKNTQKGWLAASMVGYDRDGQSLLDQELIIARANEGNIQVYRIGHHRSDADQFGYFGEPHAVISPTGTRVLFASDWSGSEDGKSVDSYVVELPAYKNDDEPPVDFPNVIDWNSAPTEITAGTNQIPLKFSINEDGVVVVQLFNKDWAQIGQEFRNVSAGKNQTVTLALQPNQTLTDVIYLQAKLLNPSWKDLKRIELKFNSKSNDQPGGNSIDWGVEPKNITSGTNQISVKYNLIQDGVVVLQLFNKDWAQIGQEFQNVKAGENQTYTFALKPNQTPTGTNYLQAKLLNPSWVSIVENPTQAVVTFDSNNKLKNGEEVNKLSILPNPFSNQTLINYQVEKSGPVSISIHSADGKQVKELVNNTYYEAGNHQLSIDGKQLSPGMYFMHFTMGDLEIVEKLYKY